MRIKNIPLAVFLSILVLMNYGAALLNGYIIDDLALLTHSDSYVSQTFSDQALRDEVSRTSMIYRPLNRLLFNRLGAFPFIFHLINIVLFLLCCLSLQHLFTLIIDDTKIAWLATIFYCLHPIHATSVVIPSFNVIWMSVFLTNVSFIFFLHYITNGKRSLLTLSLVLFIFSLFFFKGAIVMPLCLALALFFIYKKSIKYIVKNTLSYFLIIVAFMGVCFHRHIKELIDIPAAPFPLFKLPTDFFQIFSGLSYLSFTYVKNLIIPSKIVLIDNILPGNIPFHYGIIGMLIIIILGIIIQFIFKRSYKTFALLWGLSGLILLSVGMFGHLHLGLTLQVYRMSFTSAGFFLLLACLLYPLKNLIPKLLWLILIALFSSTLFLATQQYIFLARSKMDFNTHWLMNSPHNILPMEALARLKAEENKFGDAFTLYGMVLDCSLHPPASIYNDIAGIHIKRGRVALAHKNITSALSIKADNPESLYLLGVLAQRKGEIDQATILYQKALKQAPHFTKAILKLSGIYLLQEKPVKAIHLLQKAKRNNPPQEYVCDLEQQLIFAYLANDNINKGFDLIRRLINSRKGDCVFRVAQAFANNGMNTFANKLKNIARILK